MVGARRVVAVVHLQQRRHSFEPATRTRTLRAGREARPADDRTHCRSLPKSRRCLSAASRPPSWKQWQPRGSLLGARHSMAPDTVAEAEGIGHFSAEFTPPRSGALPAKTTSPLPSAASPAVARAHLPREARHHALRSASGRAGRGLPTHEVIEAHGQAFNAPAESWAGPTTGWIHERAALAGRVG